MKLSDYATIKRGSSPRPIMNYLTDSGLPWLKISDFSFGQRYVYKTKEFIINEGLKNTKYVPKGTLVVTNSATPGIPIFLGKDMCLHDGFLYLENISKSINPMYLYYYILTHRYELVGQGNGSIFINLKKEILENLSIDVPKKVDQNHIVDTIGSIDDLIESKQKENDKINLLIQSLFRKYTNNVEKIRIGELEGYAIIKSGITVFEGSKIYLDTASVDRNGIASRDYIITMTEKPSRANMQPIPKSIWFAKLKDSPKYLFVQDYMKDILKDYIFSTGFLGLEAQTRFIANYLYALITSDDFDVQKNALSIGATMQGINNDSFKEIMVPCLSIDQMNSIGEGFDSLLVQIYSNNRKIQELNNLKQLYLKKFFG